MLGEVSALLDGLSGTDWHSLSGSELTRALLLVEGVQRRIGAAQTRILAAAEADGSWALDGPRTFPTWVRQQTGTTRQAATGQVRRARGLRDHLPFADAAWAHGRIGPEHVGALVRHAIITQPLREQLLDSELGEEFLVTQAQAMDAGRFTLLVRSWANAADPDAADRAWRDDQSQRSFTVSPTLGGYHLNGWLDELDGQVLTTALAARTSPRAAGDIRTPAQRRACALIDMARRDLDSGELSPHARIRPQVTVTTTYDTLQTLVAATGSVQPPPRKTAHSTLSGLGGPRAEEAAPRAPSWARTAAVGDRGEETTDRAGQSRAESFALSPEAREWMRSWTAGDEHVISTAIDSARLTGLPPATLEDGSPLSPAALSRMLCDSALARVVFGPRSTVLDVGREQRIFPGHMARAVIARDRHCQYPGCDQPPGHGEIHHSLQWYRDRGPTSVEHGILLCWHHHTWVHRREITIHRTNGRWHFYDKHGGRITTDPPVFTAPPTSPEPTGPPAHHDPPHPPAHPR